MSELWHSFLTNTGRSAHKWTHYFPIYERHFARFRDLSVVVLEIGCERGGSLELWRRYFGPMARIVGIDVEPSCKQIEQDQIEVFIGDQSDAGFLRRVLDVIGPPDIVIDDGSHVMSYWDEYGGGLHRPESFIERSKSLVDSLNAFHSRDAVPADEFARTTTSIHFYDSIVVFEKGVHRLTTAPRIPGP